MTKRGISSPRFFLCLFNAVKDCVGNQNQLFMKDLFTKLLISALLLISQTATAYDFMVDGLCYNENADGKTVALVGYENGYFQQAHTTLNDGKVEIPEHVAYGNTTYTVTAIGGSAFKRCKELTGVSIPPSIVFIDEFTWHNCYNLNGVYIKDLEKWCEIDFNAMTNANPLFYADRLFLNGEEVTELVIPNTVTEIKFAQFYGCTSIKSLVIPESVTAIKKSAFANCLELTDIIIGDNVISIGPYAFSNCESLTNLTIGKSVTDWSGDWSGSGQFSGCANLKSIINLAPIPQQIDAGVFGDLVKQNCNLYVPKESIELYKSAPQWKFFNIHEYTSGVDDIMINAQNKRDQRYDLLGQPVDENYHGIVIENGVKKIMQ